MKKANTILNLNKMNLNEEMPFAFTPGTYLGYVLPLQEPFM